jgi:uncharacterized membrane protein YdjX (TVP38/TMEM64 family)
MNKIGAIFLDVIPRDKASRARRIWYLAGFTAAVLVMSFLILLATVKLQTYLNRPLREYAVYAYIGVFVLTFLNSCTVIFPAPGMALVLAAASKWNPALVAVAAAIGGSLGEITGYYVGRAGKSVLVSEQSEIYKRAKRWMRRYGGWVVTFLAMVPLAPFDIVGIVAGGLKFPLGKFLLFAFLGRLPRTFVEVYFGRGLLHIMLRLILGFRS